MADTNFNGLADVEYQLEIRFKIGEFVHRVKVACYTTTCNLLVQNMGGKHEMKAYLQNKHVARFFSDEFILPFGQKALSENPSIDDKYIPSLKLEIKKLQELHFRNKKKTIKPLPKSLKCANSSCKFPGGNVSTKNVSAYGQCANCEGCEHFNCAKVKESRKIDYINGVEKFVCTTCFAKNPKAVAIEKNVTDIERQNRIKHVVRADIHNDIQVLEIEDVTLVETVDKNEAEKGFWSPEEDCGSEQ